MAYLTIVPDYTGFCIKDDFAGQLAIEELRLPQAYIDAISSWNESYKAIIPLSEEQRQVRKKEIEELDRLGIEFSKILKDLVPGGAKVKYFSEGFLKYLPVVLEYSGGQVYSLLAGRLCHSVGIFDWERSDDHSSYHLPLVGSRRNAWDAWEEGNYLGAAGHTGLLGVEAFGLRGLGKVWGAGRVWWGGKLMPRSKAFPKPVKNAYQLAKTSGG
jgi:hypothetical protein